MNDLKIGLSCHFNLFVNDLIITKPRVKFLLVGPPFKL